MSDETAVVFSGPHEQDDIAPSNPMGLDLSNANPVAALQKAEELVQYMSNKCKGPMYISVISGRNYPKVDWWTTVGMSLGLFAHEDEVERIPCEDAREIKFRAVVSVRSGGVIVTRASHIASSAEGKPWGKQEYSVRSMAVTRATGKAFRIGLSGLAVMAGLEPTPAEEMPPGQPAQSQAQPQSQGQGQPHPAAPDPERMKGHPATKKQVGQLASLLKSHVVTDEERAKVQPAIDRWNKQGAEGAAKAGLDKAWFSQSIDWWQIAIAARKAAEKAKQEDGATGQGTPVDAPAQPDDAPSSDAPDPADNREALVKEGLELIAYCRDNGLIPADDAENETKWLQDGRRTESQIVNQVQGYRQRVADFEASMEAETDAEPAGNLFDA